MPRTARLMIVAAALLTLSVLVLPLWTVHLIAPQYPEGLGIAIHAGTVVGLKPSDLQSINGLNHYIGMQPIVPEMIPELRWMPWVLVGLALGGLLVAGIGSRRAAFAWLAAFVLLGAAGIWDFHRWEYDYGHNLDAANAIIVVPGMNYQPPLLGSKQLLNFTATSWPATGTIALGLAFVLAAAAAVGRRGPRVGTAIPRATLLAPGAV